MRLVSSWHIMKNISGREELYVNPPVSVIMPQYSGMAHFLVTLSNPPSCHISLNTSSHVLHASGRDMHITVSMSGLR